MKIELPRCPDLTRIKLIIMRLSQNFSFWENNLRFMGKSGL
jgi:hypothetical protein